MTQTQHSLTYGFLSRLPETPELATWTCPVCGVIPAKELRLQGHIRYRKQQCACQEADILRQRAEKERKEFLETGFKTAYCWLGERYSDIELQEKTFSTFDVSRQKAAYETCKMFADSPEGTLVLHGTFGTGKTHLLAAIVNERLTGPLKASSLFTTAPKLFYAIQSRIRSDEDYQGLVIRAIRTPLLVIDDIDKAKWSEFREEIYFDIIDGRVKAGRPTAISTNRLDELEKFVGGAVCSRLKVGQIAEAMNGVDYREEMY